MSRFLAWLASWGPQGLLGLATIESLGIPNPGGTDLALVALAAARPDTAVLAALCAMLGSIIGSSVFFEITRKGGEKLLARYTRSGRGLRLREWYGHYGMLTVFISALLPIPFLPFKVFAACAGALGVRRRSFLMVLGSARVPRYAGLAYLGTRLGPDSWPWLRSHVWHLTAFALGLFCALYAIVHWLERNRLARAAGPA